MMNSSSKRLVNLIKSTTTNSRSTTTTIIPNLNRKLSSTSSSPNSSTSTTTATTPSTSTSTSSTPKSKSNDQSYLADILPGPTSRSRYQTYYNQTLSTDLLYLLYSHSNHSTSTSLPNPLDRSPIWDPSNPYSINRSPPRGKGGRYLVPNPGFNKIETLPKLLSITISTMDKSALANKNNLLPLLMAYSTITGEPLASKTPGSLYGPGSNRGLIITRSTKKSASFKIRAGAPTGVKVTLKGNSMYAFLETLVEFVLPRLKTFSGVPLPSLSHPRQSPSSTSGVVSFGLPAEAMGLFPQIEINLDQYSKSFGFNLYFLTSARGRGGQDQARAVMSGLGIPFIKK